MDSNSPHINTLQKVALFGLNLANGFMFVAFSRQTWINFFNHSAIRFIVFPLIAISSLVNASIECWRFHHEVNKNLTNSANFSLTLAFTLGGTIANVGGLVAAIFFHSMFGLGVYFILAAVGVGLCSSLVQALLYLHLYTKAPNLSIQKSLYKQMIAQQVFSFFMCSSIFFGLVFTAILPMTTIAPQCAAFFFVSDAIWTSLLPQEYKTQIKTFFGFSEPIIDMEIKPSLEQNKNMLSADESKLIEGAQAKTFSLFSPAFRKEQVHDLLSKGKHKAAKTYLLTELNQKIASMALAVKQNNNQKHQHKILLLKEIQSSLSQSKSISETEIEDLVKTNFLAKQSFFSVAFGDVDDLIQAVSLYVREAQIYQNEDRLENLEVKAM